ncbi:hypothetical protein V8C34DRAFT_296519 [Trichoderma compactum]
MCPKIHSIQLQPARVLYPWASLFFFFPFASFCLLFPFPLVSQHARVAGGINAACLMRYAGNAAHDCCIRT